MMSPKVKRILILLLLAGLTVIFLSAAVLLNQEGDLFLIPVYKTWVYSDASTLIRTLSI